MTTAGYALFLDVTGVPHSYQHLRTRLHIEQVRLLAWGGNVGLVEELLDHPSQVLQFNRNLILDILLEIQAAFKSCVDIGKKYDSFVPQGSTGMSTPLGSKPASYLKKTLAILDKQPKVVSRLQWAMVKQSQFEGLIRKLIDYNDRIESLLDRSSLEKVHLMQQQTHMAMLQLAEQVSELHALSQAILIKGNKLSTHPEPTLSRSSTLIAEAPSDVVLFADLAAFKAQTAGKQPDGLSLAYHKLALMNAEDESLTRVVGRYEGRGVFVEWRESIDDPRPHSQIDEIVRERVEKLAALLHSPLKPPAFRAPFCIGYVRRVDTVPPRYGLVYDDEKTFAKSERQSKPSIDSTSLRYLLSTPSVPSLTRRVGLARSVASALMYLHSVNWLHKGLRSDNVLLSRWKSAEAHDWYKAANLEAPILSGFDYSRPDLPEEATLRNPSKIVYDLYRHPDLLHMDSTVRAQKSHDIYSLGIVLLEIAHWKPIESVMGIELGQKSTRSLVGKIRDQLINDPRFREAADSAVGETFTKVIWRCIEGGWTAKGDIETSAVVGAEMQHVFFEDVWRPLEDMKI